jgi:hypothetical protein
LTGTFLTMAFNDAVGSARNGAGLVEDILNSVERVQGLRESSRMAAEVKLEGNVRAIMDGSFAKLLSRNSTGWVGGRRPDSLVLREGWAPTLEKAAEMLKPEEMAIFEVFVFILQTLSSSQDTFDCARTFLDSLVPNDLPTHRDGRSRLLDLMIHQQGRDNNLADYDFSAVDIFTTRGSLLTLRIDGVSILGPAAAANQDLVLPGDRTTLAILEILAGCTNGVKVHNQDELDNLQREQRYSWYLDPPPPNVESLAHEGPCSQRTELGTVGRDLEGALCCFCNSCCSDLRSILFDNVDFNILQYTKGHPIHPSNESSMWEETTEKMRGEMIKTFGNTDTLISYEEAVAVSRTEEDFQLLHQHNLRALRASKMHRERHQVEPDLRWVRTNSPGGEKLRSCSIWAVPTQSNNVALCSAVRGCTAYRVVKPHVANEVVENFAALASKGDILSMATMAATLLAQTQLYLAYILGMCRSLPTTCIFPLGLADCCSIKHHPRHSSRFTNFCSDGTQIPLCTFSAHDEQIPHPISFFLAGTHATQPYPDLLYYDRTNEGIPFRLDKSWIRGSRLGVLTSTSCVKSIFTVSDLSGEWTALSKYLKYERTGRDLRTWAGQWLENAGPVAAGHRRMRNGEILPPDLFTNGFYQVRAMDEVVLTATAVCNTACEAMRVLSRRHPEPVCTPQPPLLDNRFWTGQFRISHLLLGIPSLNQQQTLNWSDALNVLYPDTTLHCQCERDPRKHDLDSMAYPPRGAVRLVLPNLGDLHKYMNGQHRNRFGPKSLHVAVCGSVSPDTLDSVGGAWSQIPGVCGNCTLEWSQAMRYQVVVEGISLR